MTKMSACLALLLAALPAAARAQSSPIHVDGAPAMDLDWRAIGGGPETVVFLGDVHSSSQIKKALARAMLDFARGGAGALAVEMLHESDQPLLDRYATDPKARALIGRRIGAAWMAPAEDYLKLLDAASAAGLNLVALNPDPTPGEADDSYGPVGPGAKSARNTRMADRLAALSRRPGEGRVLVFIGADHARRDALPALLRADGVASRSYAFASSGDPAARRLAVAGLGDGEWLLPGGGAYDGLLFVPAVAREAAPR